MAIEKNIQFANNELKFLLEEINQLDDDIITPLTEEEVIEFEASYQPQTIDPDRDQRQREYLEKLRQERLANTVELTGLFNQAGVIGLSRRDFIKQIKQVGIGGDILLKLERRDISELPNRLFHQIADLLNIDIRSIYLYLAQPPKGMEQMAASSKDKPTANRMETWREAVLNSRSMSETDKAYWLEAK